MNTNLWSGRWKGREPLGDNHQRARNVISPSGGIMRGKFPSRKNGRMVHHEGLLELDAIYLLEASPQVARYREQPTTITYPDGERVRRYTPDLEVTLDCGQSIWIEVKPTRFLQKEDVQHKLGCISAHLKRSNQPFVILTDEVLRQEPRQSNVRTICHRAARIRPTAELGRMVMARCADELPTTLARTTLLLACHGIEPYSLLMAGLLRCDLDKPLSPDTQLKFTKEADHDWFWIAQEHGF
ncbi:MAG: Tn7 transposase TnsA N-terminal domain-containing protein [Burkholderiaceae bacterium]|nr:Tn7 transposase TnsA N-terminal domain-containing protein [Burkholderiaceae bacterium]